MRNIKKKKGPEAQIKKIKDQNEFQFLKTEELEGRDKITLLINSKKIQDRGALSRKK